MKEWSDCQYKGDMDDILDMATGANTGFADLRTFLCAADEQGTDLPFVLQFAKLCRLAVEGKLR